MTINGHDVNKATAEILILKAKNRVGKDDYKMYLPKVSPPAFLQEIIRLLFEVTLST
jgi:hypothetical protein